MSIAVFGPYYLAFLASFLVKSTDSIVRLVVFGPYLLVLSCFFVLKSTDTKKQEKYCSRSVLPQDTGEHFVLGQGDVSH